MARAIDPRSWQLRDEDLKRREEWDREIKVGWGKTTFEQWANRFVGKSLKRARDVLRTDRLQSLLSDRDKLTEDYLFAKRQWHQESERAERLENELAPLRKLRDDPNWEVVRAALTQTEVP